MRWNIAMKIAGSLILVCLCLTGCGPGPANTYSSFSPTDGSNPYALNPDDIKFLDQAESNASWDGDFSGLQFTTRDGQTLPLKDVAPGKPLVLVMTRGYGGSICPYCSTQVSRLIANYGQFQQRNAEVVVVYPLEKPGDQAKSDEFVNRAISMLSPRTKKEVPFPLVLDLELKAVDSLGIRRDLSKPATYILDADGRLQFAYVGNSLADRPSVQALMEQLDKINQQAERS